MPSQPWCAIAFLLLHVYQSIAICSNGTLCDPALVNLEPQTQNAVMNTFVNYTCRVLPGYSHVFFLVDCQSQSELSTTANDRGIHFPVITGTEITLTLTIQAQVVNNNSNITCVYRYVDIVNQVCHSTTSFLYVEGNPPMSSVSLTGLRIGSTSVIPTTITPTVTSISNIYTTFSATPTTTPVDDGGGGNDDDDDNNEAAIIAGAVVGGIIIICVVAIIVGILLVKKYGNCCRKRGSCTISGIRNRPEPSNGETVHEHLAMSTLGESQPE